MLDAAKDENSGGADRGVGDVGSEHEGAEGARRNHNICSLAKVVKEMHTNRMNAWGRQRP